MIKQNFPKSKKPGTAVPYLEKWTDLVVIGTSWPFFVKSSYIFVLTAGTHDCGLLLDFVDVLQQLGSVRVVEVVD